MAYHNNPRIVTDGLVLCLDANDKKSAPSEDLPIKDGCVTWLDGADDSVFTYSSGTLVSEWRDKSGNANHVYQSTTASQPTRNTTYSGSGSNAKNVVVFDGTDDSLSSTNSLDLSTGYTMFVLVRGYTSTSDAGVISINNSLSHGITIHNGSLAYFYFGGGGINTTQSIATSQTNILTKVWTGSTSGNRISYKNGTQGYSTGTMSNTNATGVLRLGQQSTYLNGFIGEVIIYNRELTAAELIKVHGYLSNKWGNTVSGDSWFDLMNNGNATLTNAVYNSNGYFIFDGNGDYAIIDDDSSLIMADNTPFTVEMWAAKDTDNTNSSPMMLHYRGISGYPSFTILAYGTNGDYGDYGSTMEADNDQDGDGTTGTSLFSDRNNAIDPNGAWGLFTVSYTGSSGNHEVNIYFNGSKISSATSTSSQVWKKPTNPYNGGITIGSSAHSVGNTTHGYEGKIASIRIYNRKLTDSEILQNYNAHKTRFGL
jgi:hypothetical protein